MQRPSRSSVIGVCAALLAGLLVAASMPPWGWWPLGFLGLAIWEWTLAGQRPAVRMRRTMVFALAWFAPALWWMWRFSAPGYLVVLLLFALIQGAATLALPGHPNDRWRWLALPSALTATEALRFCFPFGGVPLASLAIGQAAGPLSGIARIGGPVLLTFVIAFIGTNLRRVVASIITSDCPLRTRVIPTASALVFLPGMIGLGAAAPRGFNTGQSVTVTIVQGGGPQGTRAVNTRVRDTIERTLAVTHTITGKTDVVIWPENVVNVIDLEASIELTEVAAEAARIGAPILAGITERDPNPKRFRNAHVVVMPDGTVSSRYEKKRRVPFGEYMPLRGFLASIGAPTNLVPRDAVPGTTPGILFTPTASIAVAISWEDFFAGRVREGVREGAGFVTNPTNGASYVGSILQSQQVAASRLRAIESGRWVAQVATTGFSAFVSPTGTVYDRIGQTEAAWRQRTIPLRSGLTWYHQLGDKPFVLLVVLLWSVPTFERLWRRRRRHVSDDADSATSRPEP